MHITFVKEARLDEEAGPPHYKPGYFVDAAPDFARAMINKGFAVEGKVEVATLPTEPQQEAQEETGKEATEEPAEVEPTRGRRRR